jgi:hypothetical protein
MTILQHSEKEKFSYADLLAMNDDQRWKLIKGEHFQSPRYHCHGSSKLSFVEKTFDSIYCKNMKNMRIRRK